jgi:hypothetical protein
MNRCEICAQTCNLDDVLCGVCRETITCLAQIQPQKRPNMRTGATFGGLVAEQPDAGIARPSLASTSCLFAIGHS